MTVGRVVIERAIAEGGGEHERVGVSVGLPGGVVDPVGDAGLLGDVPLVGGGGVVVLCHEAGGDGEASGFYFIGPRIDAVFL